MKINFESNINDFQNARRFKMMLEHYSHSDIVDKNTQLFIESLLDQINAFLSDPEFERFKISFEAGKTGLVRGSSGVTIISRIYSGWRNLTGPTRRELALSNQRHELIERAERAEAIAFEAIAETTDVGRQRDAALKKLQEMEKTR